MVGNAQARPYVYLNGCDGRAWLTVALADNPPNGAAIGARVRVTAAGMVQTRHILGGSEGLYGTSAPEAYFGFGTATVGTADVEVRWPDGRVTTHAGVQTRRHVTIRRQSP